MISTGVGWVDPEVIADSLPPVLGSIDASKKQILGRYRYNFIKEVMKRKE